MSRSIPSRDRIPAGRIALKRAYLPAAATDGARVLVDRLWPRGVRKAEAAIDLWLKDIAPSPGLRTWFDHDPARWPEFRRRYAAELHKHAGGIARLRAMARRGKLTFVFAARDVMRNDAVVLRNVVLGRQQPRTANHRDTE